jgi:hypothetical protein
MLIFAANDLARTSHGYQLADLAVELAQASERPIRS